MQRRLLHAQFLQLGCKRVVVLAACIVDTRWIVLTPAAACLPAVCLAGCRTPGFTGADLQNLMNEAAILAARRNLKEISKEEIADALERIIAGAAPLLHVSHIGVTYMSMCGCMC
jgi:predicted aminopeptidase